jgi:hypothetical protein
LTACVLWSRGSRSRCTPPSTASAYVALADRPIPSTVVNGLAQSPYVPHVRSKRFLRFASLPQLNWLQWRRLGPLNEPVRYQTRYWRVLFRQQPEDDSPKLHCVSRREYREDSKERCIIGRQTPFERTPQPSRAEGNGHQVHRRGRVPPGRSVGTMG